jgi:O-antigen/teichoic acid export membrane protein
VTPLKTNVLANYASQIYVTVIGIVMVPVLLRYMGPEAYGLVGFFAMLQGWFLVLDLGFSAALSREAARRKGQLAEMGDLRLLLRGVERLFALLGASVALCALVLAPFVATTWLQAERLPTEEVRAAFVLMTFAALLRWMSGLYRGVIGGLERQVWLGVFSSLVATARFVGVLLVFAWVGTGPGAFFTYQLAVAAIELVVAAAAAYRWLPSGEGPVQLPRSPARPVRSLGMFALSTAFASLVWALATQADKLLLSRMLTLTEFGYFSVAVVAASAVLTMTNPLGMAVLPRLSRLVREEDLAGTIALYRRATQTTAVACVPIVLVMGCFSERMLWAWTGDAATASQASSVLAPYAVGYGFLALAALPYYLQHARGSLGLHLKGSMLFVVVLLPLLWVSVERLGMAGAGWAWLAVNMLFFFAWVPLAHRRFLPGVHVSWLAEDIVPIVLPTALVAVALANLLAWPGGRVATALQLVVVGMLLTGCAAIASRQIRQHVAHLVKKGAAR